MNSTSHWEQLSTFGTGKQLRGIPKGGIIAGDGQDWDNLPQSVKDRIKEFDYSTKDEKYIYISNDSKDSFNTKSSVTKPEYKDGDVDEVNDDNRAIDIDTDDSLEFGENGGPMICYVDDNGFLRCFASNTSPSNKSGSVTNGMINSFIYYKSDEQNIKSEILRIALGKFVSALDAMSSNSRVSAVRFSTGEAVTAGQQKNFLLQDWSNELSDAIDIISQSKKGEENHAGYFSTDGQSYNYALTGGTATLYGLQAFENMLESGKDEGHGQNIIIFTDGKDSTGEAEQQKSKQLAQKLKTAGWTIYCVVLPNCDFEGETAETIRTFVKDLSGTSETDKDSSFNKTDKYYFEIGQSDG